MQKIWLKKPELKYKEVIDIVQFGSTLLLESNPNDLDIAVFFKNMTLKSQLLKAQQIKKELQKLTLIPIHIKSFDMDSFFDEGNFARESILFYGKSLFTEDYFAKRFRLLPRIQIYYSLDNLPKKDKVRFHYLLKGKKNNSGLLNKYGGLLLKPGLIEIFPEHEKIFIDRIKKHNVNFEIKKVLIEIKE